MNNNKMNHKKNIISILISLTLLITTSYADTTEHKMRFELPLIGEDNNISYLAPSMQNATNISKDFNKGLFLLTDKIDNAFLRQLANSVVLYFPLPLGAAWLHEEFHIQSLATVGLKGQKDGVYDLNLTSSTIAVYGASDQQLAFYKSNYPKEWVRSHSAGYESTTYFIESLLQDNFIYNERPKNDASYPVAYWTVLIGSIGYLASSRVSDEIITEMSSKESADPKTRDLRGWDFNSWTYDLFRPNLSFADARLDHPSGVGKLRSVRYDQLSNAEKKYLNRQISLSLLNFVNPALYGYSYFQYGDTKYNAYLNHYLTSFGSSINANFLYKRDDIKLLASYMKQENYQNSFPGISVSLIEYPVNKFFITTKLSIFSQPENGDFKTNKSKTGYLIGINANYPVYKNVRYNLGIQNKSYGWVAGVASLKATTIITSSISFSY